MHLAKANSSIYTTDIEMMIFVRDSHTEKVPIPIDITEDVIMMLVSDVHVASA